VESYKSSHTFDRVGLVIPGLVDIKEGISVFTGTLGWRNLRITEAISQRTGVPVHLDHDVTAAGLAELQLGASAPFKNSVLIQIGTGIASAIVLNGEIYRPHQQVGEIGHASIGNDRPCPCGLTGCLEMTASGGAISRTYFAKTGETISPMEIFKRAQRGEAVASAVWQELVDSLALSFSWLASTIAPEAIIMGGGIAQAGEPFAAAVEESLKTRLSIHQLPKILISELADQAACLGAGLMARSRP
jgi:glucokinase